MSRLNSTIFPELTDHALAQLFSHNIYSVSDFVLESHDKLMKYTELSYKDISGIKKCIFEIFSGRVETASNEFFNESKVSSGIAQLDSLLNNGFTVGCLYDICGMPSAGKSQLCHSLAIHLTLNLSRTVHYIDTKGDFCASRILEMLESRRCTDEQIGRVMKLIKVTKVNDKKELLSLLHSLINSLQSSPSSLVIIDSLPSIFFKTSQNDTVNIFLSHLANLCKFLAKERQQIIITTNIVSQWSEVDGLVFNQQTNPITIKPALGKYWLDIPDTRLLLESLENAERKISIWKSTHLKLQTFCKVRIGEAGIE